MSDPKRWLDDSSELGEDERRALRAGLEGEPSRESAVRGDARRAVWGALVAKLPAAATATGGGAAAAGGSAGGAGATAGGTAAGGATVAAGSALGTLLKPLAIGLALGTATAGGVAVTRQAASPSPSLASPAAMSAPAPASVPEPDLPRGDNDANPVRSPERQPLEAPLQESPAPLRAPASAPPEPAAAPLGSDSTGPAGPSQAAFPSEADASVLDLAESRRIARARALLRGSNARGALVELEAVRRDFPNGTLAQEREALSIEALLALGEKATARERARAFLSRYPKSPHAALVRRALE